MSSLGLPVIRTKSPAPLEGQDVGTARGMFGAFTAAGVGSVGASLLARAVPGGPDNTFIPRDEAAKQMQAQGYDPSVLPTDGIYQSSLDAIMAQQSVVTNASDAAKRAHLGPVSSFVSGLAGGATDPVFLALGPLGRIAEEGATGIRALAAGKAGIEGAKGSGLASRVAVGAAEGGAVMGGYTEAEKQFGTAPGDKDITSYEVLRATGYGSVLGGAVKGAFGARRAMDSSIDSILQEEGGKTVDTGGATNMGISQKAHPNIDVSKLKVSDARAIYKIEYWDKIDGDNLPANMQITALDAAVNQGVGNAVKWLAEAKGDPAAFNALRRAHYEQLAKDNPAKYGKYLQAWLDRLGRVSLKSVDPYFPDVRGPASSVLGHDMETTLEQSPWSRGPTSHVDSGLEVPAPESGEAYSSVQADRAAAQSASEAGTLDALGKTKLPITTAYPGSVSLEVGESLRRFSARGYEDPREIAASLPPEVKADTAKAAVAQISQDSEGNVAPVIRAGLTGSVFGLEDAAPKPGTAIINDRLNKAMLDKINIRMEEVPKTATTNDDELTQLRAQANEAMAAAEHAHGLAFGPAGKPFKEAMDAHLEDHAKATIPEEDRLLHEVPDLIKAIEAAARCSIVKGIE